MFLKHVIFIGSLADFKIYSDGQERGNMSSSSKPGETNEVPRWKKRTKKPTMEERKKESMKEGKKEGKKERRKRRKEEREERRKMKR